MTGTLPPVISNNPAICSGTRGIAGFLPYGIVSIFPEEDGTITESYKEMSLENPGLRA